MKSRAASEKGYKNMKYIVTINQKSYEVEVEKGEAQVLSVAAVMPAEAPPAAVPAPAPSPALPASVAHAPVHAVAGEALTAPMPGTVISVLKKKGDKVMTGEVVLILEAMKMENEVVACADGTISQVLVAKGTIVKTGDPLVMIH